VLALLREVAHVDGLAMLCNLHQVELAHRFADRVIALRDGRIVGRIDSVPLMPRRFA
jgi:phosphonate transport system ATP-binding protein